jgi:hypothetical protein
MSETEYPYCLKLNGEYFNEFATHEGAMRVAVWLWNRSDLWPGEITIERWGWAN